MLKIVGTAVWAGIPWHGWKRVVLGIGVRMTDFYALKLNMMIIVCRSRYFEFMFGSGDKAVDVIVEYWRWRLWR